MDSPLVKMLLRLGRRVSDKCWLPAAFLKGVSAEQTEITKAKDADD